MDPRSPSQGKSQFHHHHNVCATRELKQPMYPCVFLVYRWHRVPVPHYKTGTNWVCQIVGLLMKPVHACLCVSFILNQDPKKIQPNHKTPLTSREGHSERGQTRRKKTETFFRKCGSNGFTIRDLNLKHSTTISLLLQNKNAKNIKKNKSPPTQKQGCFRNQRQNKYPDSTGDILSPNMWTERNSGTQSGFKLESKCHSNTLSLLWNTGRLKVTWWTPTATYKDPNHPTL